MPDFDLSLVVRGTDDGASAVGQKTAQALDRLTAAEERVALASAKSKVTSDNLKESYSTRQAVITRLAAAEEKLAIAEANAAAKAQLMSATLRSSRLNLSNFGSQFQDITQSLVLGINPMTVFMQQSGQLAFSLTGLAGTAGRVARFFAGPWGSVMIAAAGILGMFALRGHEAAHSQEDLGDMADYVGRAQSQLGKIIDLVTGKFTSQNQVLREAIRLQAMLAEQQAIKRGQEAGRSLSATDTSGFFGTAYGGGESLFGRVTGREGPTADFRKLVADFKSNANYSIVQFRRALDQMGAAGKLTGVDINKAMEQALEIAAARGDVRANRDIQAIIEGREGLPDYLKKPGKTHKPKKGPKEKDPFGLEEFGRDAANRIRDLAKAFGDTPPQVERVNTAVSQLDDLIDDIQHKKPPNMKELLADAERARTAIENGINKPYNDFILQQQQALDVAKLITQGHYDEADALVIVQKMERESGALTQERKDAVLATVQALRAEAREADILRQKQQKYLDLLESIKDAIKGVFSDPIEGLKDLPGKLVGAAAKFKTDKLFEDIFGPTFRKLEDRITGTQTAEDAAAKMAVAVDAASQANRRAAVAINDLANAAGGASSALQGVDPLAPMPEGGTPGTPSPYGPDIVVTGNRPTDLPTILQKLSQGIGISDDGAKKIGTLAGKGLEGAATGALTNQFLKPLGKALGFKTSAMGAQIGGAIGSFLPIPGGDIIGSIVGSVIGGLFKGNKPPPSGGAVITNVYDAPAGFGDKGIRNASTALAESVQGGLLQIAESLGGTLGSFAVSVGQFDKDWRVNINGLTGSALNRQTPGTFDFNEDQAAALRFAIADAVKDGAIIGLSDAVTKALGAYEDIDRSLREALKVQQLEDLIAGVGGSLTRIFKQFDTEAAERVRLAKTYGLDLLAVEKLNADQRTKLVSDLLKQSLGSLEDLKKSLQFGDLFEGDASTRRASLLSEITTVKKEVDAGVEGATDQLSALYRQLLETSKEAYGTAGPEYAADRALVTKGIDSVIAAEKARIEAAAAYQQATLDAATTNNALTNETNDLLAAVNARLDVLIGGSASSSASLAPSGSGTVRVASY